MDISEKTSCDHCGTFYDRMKTKTKYRDTGEHKGLVYCVVCKDCPNKSWIGTECHYQNNTFESLAEDKIYEMERNPNYE